MKVALTAGACIAVSLLALWFFLQSTSVHKDTDGTTFNLRVNLRSDGMGAGGGKLTPFQTLQGFVKRSHMTTDTLVIYVFSNTDPQYVENLHFFMREGVKENDGCEYIFVINEGSDDVIPELPPLKSNTRYIHHANECYDWGTFGWVLESQGIALTEYSYFIFLNSSVRGPFLPSYVKDRVHWVDVLLSKINDDVKLVGPTINCEPVPKADLTVWRGNPHVQSYTVATDQVGMQILLRAGDVFNCYKNMTDTIFFSEVGSSKAILDAGYNIDSMMIRYQGIDWRDPSNWNCNRHKNPFGHGFNDGATLEAMEVMFVKVKSYLLEQKWPYMIAASHYDEWYNARSQGQQEVHQNHYVDHPADYRLAGVLVGLERGLSCFDCRFYKLKNPDLPRTWTCKQLFEHYVNDGQVEGRISRYTCTFDASKVLPKYYHVRPGEERKAQLVRRRRLLSASEAAELGDHLLEDIGFGDPADFYWYSASEDEHGRYPEYSS